MSSFFPLPSLASPRNLSGSDRDQEENPWLEGDILWSHVLRLEV